MRIRNKILPWDNANNATTQWEGKKMKMKTELQTSNFKDEVNARMQRMKGKHGGWWWKCEA